MVFYLSDRQFAEKNHRQVDGKTGNLGDKVNISREKAKIHVTVEAVDGIDGIL